MHAYRLLVVCQTPLQSSQLDTTPRKADNYETFDSRVPKRGRDSPLLNDQSQSPVEFSHHPRLETKGMNARWIIILKVRDPSIYCH